MKDFYAILVIVLLTQATHQAHAADASSEVFPGVGFATLSEWKSIGPAGAG
jgi:hypothetical protein